MRRKDLARWLVWAGICAAGSLLVKRTAGVGTYLLCALVVLALFGVLHVSVELIAGLFGKAPRLMTLRKLTLACVSVVVALALFEGCLAFMAWKHTPGQPAPSAPLLTIPEAWQPRPVAIPGTIDAYYWHGHLHVYNHDRMRLAGELGPKLPGTFRIMVVGDSLTYGEGVAAESAYPSLLHKELGAKYNVEVLNLGVRGAQSEDILHTVKAFLPRLKPDLVVYGVCLNDFLPSGKGQYHNNQAWSITFPLQKHFIDKTRLGGFLARKYDEVLISTGVRADFYTDILRDFEGCQQRFGRDVKAMNDAVVADGLPPIITLVLHQHLADQQGIAIAAVAEQWLAEGGLQVVPATGYIDKHRGRILSVSQWEGHPNEEAHRVFAGELLPAIEKAPGLERFRRVSQATAAD